jgi:hypothetical protein
MNRPNSLPGAPMTYPIELPTSTPAVSTLTAATCRYVLPQADIADLRIPKRPAGRLPESPRADSIGTSR